MRSARTTHVERSRGGFTLVELLIVIAIIIILVGLTGAAFFYWTGAQQTRNSEATIRTAYKELQRQWNYVVDQAKKEAPSLAVQTMAGGDPGRARAIWIQVRLMEAFPAAYSEVTSASDPVYTYLYATQVPAGSGQYVIPPNQRRYLAGYQQALNGLSQDNSNSVTESSACLLMALTVGRGGNQLSEESLGRFVTDTDNDGIKEIVDGFGQPLEFYRFAFGMSPLATGGNSPAPNGIQGLNPAPVGSKTSRLADPLDPSGKLLTWGNNAYSQAFTIVCHPIPTPSSTAANPSAYYVIPVLVSAGQDQQLGLPLPRVANASGGLFTATGMTPTNTAVEADNIYSFNLKGN